jgi:hypothetical protein
MSISETQLTSDVGKPSTYNNEAHEHHGTFNAKPCDKRGSCKEGHEFIQTSGCFWDDTVHGDKCCTACDESRPKDEWRTEKELGKKGIPKERYCAKGR